MLLEWINFMYSSSRSNQVRNLSVAAVNGIITLVILLIAPLGLAAVIINTALVTIATYFSSIAADRVVRYLQPKPWNAEISGGASSTKMRRRQTESDLSQYD
jgi:hypothetical protein